VKGIKPGGDRLGLFPDGLLGVAVDGLDGLPLGLGEGLGGLVGGHGDGLLVGSPGGGNDLGAWVIGMEGHEGSASGGGDGVGPLAEGVVDGQLFFGVADLQADLELGRQQSQGELVETSLYPSAQAT